MKIKHTLKENLFWVYTHETHTSHLKGYVEIWERSRPRVWWLILSTIGLAIISPIITLVGGFAGLKGATEFGNEYEIYTRKVVENEK